MVRNNVVENSVTNIKAHKNMGFLLVVLMWPFAVLWRLATGEQVISLVSFIAEHDEAFDEIVSERLSTLRDDVTVREAQEIKRRLGL